MPGLSLNAGARVRGSATYGPAASPGAVTVEDAAFGPGASSTSPGVRGTLLPNDAFGITLWTGVAAVGVLLLIRHSLPR